MDGASGSILDTATVGLTCYDANNVAYVQQPVVVRSIREPKLLSCYNDKYNYTLNDSIKSELVLTYGNDVPQYVFTFIQTDGKGRGSNPIAKYISNTRWFKLSNFAPLLKTGKFYYVTVHARINNVNYCKGNFSIIGIGINMNGNGHGGHGDNDGNGDSDDHNNDLVGSTNPIEITLTAANPESDEYMIGESTTGGKIIIAGVGFTGAESISVKQQIGNRTGFIIFPTSLTNMAKLIITPIAPEYDFTGFEIPVPSGAIIKVVAEGIVGDVQLLIDIKY
jgi:hypothetical protein